MAICTCATSSSSTASRRCSTRWNSPMTSEDVLAGPAFPRMDLQEQRGRSALPPTGCSIATSRPEPPGGRERPRCGRYQAQWAAIRAKVEASGAERLESYKQRGAGALEALFQSGGRIFAMLRRGSSPSAGLLGRRQKASQGVLALRGSARAPGALATQRRRAQGDAFVVGETAHLPAPPPTLA